MTPTPEQLERIRLAAEELEAALNAQNINATVDHTVLKMEVMSVEAPVKYHHNIQVSFASYIKKGNRL